MNFCFLAWPETAHNEVYITQVDLAVRLIFGKQAVSRTDVCEGWGCRWGGQPFWTADESNTLEMAEQQVESVWVPGTEPSYQCWSTYFWTLTLKKEKYLLYLTPCNFDPLLHESGPFI